MFWIDAARGLLAAALPLAMATGLAGCAQPAGEFRVPYVFGESLDANLTMQADLAGTGRRLARDFAASAETTVTFAFNDASLDASAQAVLEDQADWLSTHPDVPMVIIGYADLVGPESYNYELGLRRAESARSYLLARGVSPARLVAAESRGEQDPIVPTMERERRNRRAVTAVAIRAGGVGPGLDGIYAAQLYNAYQAGRVDVTEADSTTVN